MSNVFEFRKAVTGMQNALKAKNNSNPEAFTLGFLQSMVTTHTSADGIKAIIETMNEYTGVIKNG
jgi:hypothetical protein